MKESDLKPLDLIQENHLLRAKDLESFKPRALEEIPCPACSSKNYMQSFCKDGYRFLTCLDCETLYVSPRPSSEDLDVFYSTAQYIRHWNEKIFPSTEKVRRVRVSTLIDQILPRVDSDHRKIAVDVGAGFGVFCEELKQRRVFDEVYAVEPSKDFAKSCREKGIRTFEKSVERIEPQELGEVSLLTGFELIEHLRWPRDFVEAGSRLLPVGGLLILTTPNIKGFDLMVLQEHSENIVAPIHLTYFHPRSIHMLLESCGFEVVSITTPGQIDADIVRNQVLSDKFILVNNFLRHILIDHWDEIGGNFQVFLRDNLISSHMMVVARKKCPN